MKRKTLLNLLLFTCLASFGQQPAFITDSLDGYIKKGMQDWNVPGLAIVIVKDGKVAFIKGYGVRDLKSGAPVDEHTLFMIASNTKLFTGMALSQLSIQKKIDLDDHFTKYYPDFPLYDSLSSQLVTVRDLLSHRIGTDEFQGDFTFWNSSLTSTQIMNKMRLLKPEHPFRTFFGYCNSCYMAAGQVIPKVTGRPWQQYIEDSILSPLGMHETYTSIHQLPDTNLLTKAYTTSFTGTLQQVPWDDWDNLAPAAAMISNVSDLSKWLIFQLDSGRYNGKQIMPFSVLQSTRDINTPISSRKSPTQPTHIEGYGLGLFVADYNGRQIFWHTGGASGIVSVVCFVPEERLGIAVLVNNDNQNLFGALRSQILDAYTGFPYRNRSDWYVKGFNKTMTDTLKTIHNWQARVTGNKPPLALTAYSGKYANPLYGGLEIRSSAGDGKLRLRFLSHPNLTATLSYMDSNEWLLTYDNRMYGIFAIRFDESNGKVKSVTTLASDEVDPTPYLFTKE